MKRLISSLIFIVFVAIIEVNHLLLNILQETMIVRGVR